MSEIYDKPNFINEITNIIQSPLSPDDKYLALNEFHDYELAQTWMELTESEKNDFHQLFTAKELAHIISLLETTDALMVISSLPDSKVRVVLNEMQDDDLADLFKAIDSEEELVKYYEMLSSSKLVSIHHLTSYDEEVVGSLMNPNFIEIPVEYTIKQAISKVVEFAPQIEFINNLYVTEHHQLVGVVSLKELISHGNQPSLPIADVMSTNLITLTPFTPNEEAVETMRNYDFMLLPVIDEENHVIGIVSFDNMVEALTIESDEDYSRIAGLTDIAIDEEKETVFSSIKKRMPWLIILLFINLFTSSIIKGYEEVLTLIPTLALFMPLILNMAGNSGTQSLGIIIRLFALNQLETKSKIIKHLIKEFFTGLVNGIIIAALLFIMVNLLQVIGGNSLSSSLPFAFTIALSISVALIVSTLAGALVPLFMNAIHVDPAVASGPFITTINDIISLIIYFGLASLLLSQWM